MKKFFVTLVCAVLSALTIVGFTACNNQDDGKITVYVPDGAPALAISQLMSENMQFSEKVSYHVVDADTISSYVTYNNNSKNADLVIMPVNAASNILTDGSSYKMLGAVTHGNLYIVANSDKEELTTENFGETIAGAKVGVVQLPKFPGVMFKTLLNKYSVSAQLSAVQPGQVDGTSSDYDYFVIPEPAATTRVGNADLNLKIVGSLQTLYGEGGYPQAVLMAKTELIEKSPDFIAEFCTALTEASEWLVSDTVSGEIILNTIKSHYADPKNTTPAFTNLSKQVIEHCAIRFEYSADCKQSVISLLTEFRQIDEGFAKVVGDNFFYIPA